MVRDRPSLTISAQQLEAGHGGIARVARLSVKALQNEADLRALAVEDKQRHLIGNVEVVPYAGHRLSFMIANAMHALVGRPVLYDFAGTARAHLPGFKLLSQYALWIHGYEVWNEPTRQDYAKAVRRADFILANSHYTLARAQEIIGPLPQARVCWLGTEQDDPAPPFKRDRPPVLLFLGRSDDLFAKGQDILIDVWPDIIAKVPDAKLVCAGGGNQLPRLLDLVRKSAAAGNIEILGFLSEAEIEAVWQRTTVFAMLSHVEGFGLAFAEAMRHAVPVLASTEDASQEINLDGVTGFNVARKNRPGIVDRIIYLLKDRDVAAALGDAGLHRWRSNFCFSAFQERMTGLVRPWLAGCMPESATSDAGVC